MSYSAITTTEIEAGKPVSQTTQNKIKDNLADHETRLQNIEGGAGTTYPPLIFRVGGPYSAYGTRTGVLKSTTNFNITITGIRLLIDSAGTAGTTEIDVLFKRGASAYTSILTTRPSVAFGAGSDSISTNAVVNPVNAALQAGDIIRLDLTSTQTGAKGFTVRIDYTRT